MQVDLAVDVSRLQERFGSGSRADRRVAFAVVNAINETAKTAQRAVQLHVQDEFTIRQPFVLRQAAIIKPFANVRKGIPYAEISVGRRRRLLLSQFEEGGLREPFKGKESVAVPVEARPSKTASVSEELHVQRLGIKRKRGKDGRVTFEGERGTYLIPRKGIFQRITAGLSRVLYVLARPFRLEKKLGFVETVSTVARRVFGDNLRRQIREALEFRKGR